MSDLSTVLPSFPTASFTKTLHSLDHHSITTSELLSRDVSTLAKLTSLPVLDLRRLAAAIAAALHASLRNTRTTSLAGLLAQPRCASALISTLDDDLDASLGGGVPAGRVTEIAGESGAGKTQLLLSLMLAVQMEAPRGLGRGALYITTEAPLATRRLAQMLATNPVLRAYNTVHRGLRAVGLDRIASASTPDLESQEHILAYQVPVMVERLDIGLLVIDSVAANYRVEYDRRGDALSARGAELSRLGQTLRGLAEKLDIAVVVANQVADRLGALTGVGLTQSQASSYGDVGASQASRDGTSTDDDAGGGLPEDVPWGLPTASAQAEPLPIAALELDHQHRFFTGWGDDPMILGNEGMKTPALGLVWSTQVAMRIALILQPVYVQMEPEDDEYGDGRERGNVTVRSSWRRFMKVVFAPHVKASSCGVSQAVEYEVVAAGLKAVVQREEEEDEEGAS
ncbi:DNA repair protein rhp57 [Ceratocystis lukuohia]|uniref:DNA repair protein rhp57 n=1 Tax=Ceratocystis lukuohia TaxID=2019550 RepID=A0ABR4MPL6_9PEZI